MDERYLREHAARCRNLAAKADEFTESRLLALAQRYEQLLKEEVDQPNERSSLGTRTSLVHRPTRK